MVGFRFWSICTGAVYNKCVISFVRSEGKILSKRLINTYYVSGLLVHQRSVHVYTRFKPGLDVYSVQRCRGIAQYFDW